MNVLFPDAIDAAKAHARAEYPKESCGVVKDGQYVACTNVAADPEHFFEIDPEEFLSLQPVEAIVHSHPNGPMHPTKIDAEQQIASALPWAIIPLDEDRMGDPIWFGDEVPMEPLIGRKFVHYVADCFTIIRDVYRLGKDELAAQDITDSWPYDPIHLPIFPREDEWWDIDQDLYIQNYEKLGFHKIDTWEARPGDAFFAVIGKSGKLNHGGVLVDDNLLLHHLPNRISRREPAGIWARQAGLWVRWNGAKK